VRKVLRTEDLRKIRKVQLKMDQIATDLIAGMYRSAFKGKGMEFEEVREFQTGDEVRSIDWNVTARMGTPFVKIFREERELTVMLLVDISSSTRFGSQNALKTTILSEIGAVLAFSGIKNQDKIGLILFSDIVEHYLPPAKGIRHVLRLIADLMAFPAKQIGTDIAKALQYFGKIQKKRCVAFLLSDFIGDKPFDSDVRTLAGIHDLIAIGIQDPLEAKIPSVGLLPLKDRETGKEELIDTSSSFFSAALPEGHSLKIKETKELFEGSGGSWIEVTTDKPYLSALRKFFLQRGKGRVR
jgi:uncharacterized protein (DUF58 family)